MSNPGFVKLHGGSLSEELLKDPKAFTLLSLIALRARFNDEPNVKSLRFGEALIGDYKACGLERKEFRNALHRLQHKWRVIECRGTPLGTIAHLLDSRVYSLTDERDSSQKGQLFSEVNPEKRANEGPTRGQQKGQRFSEGDSEKGANERATNQKEMIEMKVMTVAVATETFSNKFIPRNAEEVRQFAAENDIPANTANAWWHSIVTSGFKIRGDRMRDWRAVFLGWAKTDAKRMRSKLDPMGDDAFLDWIEAEKIEPDIVRKWSDYNERRGWEQLNPRTNRMEPIVYYRKSLLAFRDSLSDCEREIAEASAEEAADNEKLRRLKEEDEDCPF